MDSNRDSKRRKDDDEDDRRREKKSKRARSRSRSPVESRDRDSRRKRRHSRSRSPDGSNKKDRSNDQNKGTEIKAEPPPRKAKDTDMLNTRTGGAYIPPARLRMMQAQITDKSSIAYQRLAWEALKKSIHGHINKINVGNIGIIIKELLKENIVRGRGLLCRSVIQAQAASPTFTNVYAALVSAVNSRFPNIGELLLKRLVIQFKRGFKRNDKPICISSASFIAHLVNQRVAHEILALELLTLLVETPTDDSVEVAIAFLKECGQKLTEVSSKGVNAIFEMLRNILHEGQLDKRVQYMIEVMFQVWKDGFKDHPALIEELELVPEEDQFTHLLMLDDATDPQDILNVFKFDEKYEENEQKYKTLCKEILGSDAESEEEGSGESGSDESDDDEGNEESSEQPGVTIIDNTETNLVALRRTIYLTINSSLDFEECAHKLMKMQLKPGQEVELCHMFLDCCAEQRTYEKFYGLLAQRFCNINRIYIGPFEDIFKDSYATAHRLDTNRLRNVSKFFAHLLFTDSISWEVLECVKLNEEDTTSSSRIYIKILFQELAEYMGLKKLNDRLKDPTLQSAFSGVFPRDNPKNTRFSINFFTSIGLGGLTDELREHLKQMPKNVPQPTEINIASESSSDSSSSSSSSSDSSSSDSSSSDSEEESSKKKKKDKKSKKKSKDKTPKTPEDDPDKNKERWGHDGFYDTYGKDARRNENRSENRNERDKDNFAIPREVPKRNPRNDDRRDRDDSRRYNDRSKDRNDDDRRRRDDDGDRRRRDDDVGDRRRPRDDETDRSDRSRNDDDRRRPRDDEMDRNNRSRNDDDRRRPRDDHSNGRDEESRNRYRDGERRDDDRRRPRDDEADRTERNYSNSRDNEESRNKYRDEERRDRYSNRDKEQKRTDDYEKSRSRDDDKRKDDDRRERSDKEKVSEYVSDEGSRQRDKDRRDEDSRRERTENSERNSKRDSEKDRDKTDKQRKQSSGDDSEEDSRNKRRDKDSRKNDDRRDDDRLKSYEKEKKKQSKDKGSEDSSDDDSKSRRRDKDSRKADKSKKKSKKRDKENQKGDDDGWDIRGSSIRKEVVERYWDMPDKRRETVERSPERSNKGKEKRRER